MEDVCLPSGGKKYTNTNTNLFSKSHLQNMTIWELHIYIYSNNKQANKKLLTTEISTPQLLFKTIVLFYSDWAAQSLWD